MIFDPFNPNWKDDYPTLEDVAETALYVAELVPKNPIELYVNGTVFSQLCTYLEGMDNGLRDLRELAENPDIKRPEEGYMPLVQQRLRVISGVES